MEIKYIKKINNSNSTLADSASLEIVEKQISNMILDKSVGYLKQTPLTLIITLIVNPSLEERTGSFSHNERIYSVISDSLDGDSHLYSVRNRLGSITIPKNFQSLLIAIGLQEYLSAKMTKHDNNIDDDDERPTFYAKQPKWTFDDVILNIETKLRILRAVSIIENKDIIFDKWGYSSIDKATKSIICFYGPAGTGKTMTAEAIGSYLNKQIVHSSYAEIESKWVGEGAKNLHAIFSFAEEHDAVLFFDEADSFLSSRIEATESSSDKHYNRMSNELFQLLEEFNGCVIFSTNLLTDVDEAFKSRIIDSVKFELPDIETRKQLIQRMIPKDFPLASPPSETELTQLSESIEGFSGRDIRKAMLLSLADAAIRYRKDGDTFFNLKDISIGFEEVKEYKNKMIAEKGVVPTEDITAIVKKQKTNENIVDIAIHAMFSDGILHDKEKELLNELSLALLGSPLEDPIQIPQKTIEQICAECKDDITKKSLIETVVRVVAIDGIIEENEKKFVSHVAQLLDINDNSIEKLNQYCCHLAELNREWVMMDI